MRLVPLYRCRVGGEGRRGEEEGEGEISDNEVSLGEGGGGRKRGEGEIGDNQSTGTDV